MPKRGIGDASYGITATALGVAIDDNSLTVELSDGRTLVVPITWYPRLKHATPTERSNNRLIGGGTGIHWPDLDEDISVANLVLGQPSSESQASLEKWLASRGTIPRTPR
ncbi:MAG: DUF2442 domain-containing protein [Planctomycetes bacterium]|nr:DUF2442 domain-containing protein [Planctomycetota bacterium]